MNNIGALLLGLHLKWNDIASPWISIDSEREWYALFGVSPLALERIWNICGGHTNMKIEKYLLMTLHFLKTYNVGDVSHLPWGSKRSWTDHACMGHFESSVSTP